MNRMHPSKSSDLIFLFLKNHCRGLFLMNSRSVGFPGNGGGLSQSKLNIFILKECNLHSRRLLSPLLHFFWFLCAFLGFLPFILYNF